MYHACDENDSDFTRGLAINTSPSQFASHLDFLLRYYRVVSLSELLDGQATGLLVVLTFDDGFRSVYEYAWPIMRDKRVTAICYLTTDVIGNASMIWLNELNWFIQRHPSASLPLIIQRLGLHEDCSIQVIISALIQHYDQPMIGDILFELRSVLKIDSLALARESRLHLDWPEIAEMSAGGMAFGNHTGSHPPLANLSLSSCEEEIRRASAALAYLPGADSTLAYPFGSLTNEVRSIAIRLGIRSLLEVEGVNAPFDPVSIGRIKVRADSAAVLFARMEVVEPVKSALKRWGSRPPSRS
jgi:peptidoglycan/xylan/chitin deacetylase (PgdA/CDA1 family)